MNGPQNLESQSLSGRLGASKDTCCGMKPRRVLLVVAALLLVVLSCALIGVFAVPRERTPADASDGDPLYLTPYIRRQETREGREKSVVDMFAAEAGGARAYAGLITVNETLQSYYFFLHVEAQRNATSAPLLLWLQGGPGSSSLFGQFIENGPLGIDAQGSLYRRDHTIQEQLNVIYLDQPVGAGYSRTGSLDGYSKSLDDLTENVHRFLLQFLELFPEYHDRDFYVAGESYGARVAVGLAVRQHKTPDLPIRLRGVISGVGFLGPVMLLANVTEYYHQLGLMDYNGKLEYQKRLAEIQKDVDNGETFKALMLLMQTLFVSAGNSTPTLFQTLTGYRYDGNVLLSREPPEFKKYRDYVASAELKQAVHVGRNATFQRSDLINVYLAKDYFNDLTDMVQTVLQNYKFLVYVGQLDPVFSPVQTEAYFRSLKWDGAGQFNAAKHRPWYAASEDEGISGYVTAAGNLVYSLVAGAGHYAGFDQTLAGKEMICRFVKGVPL